MPKSWQTERYRAGEGGDKERESRRERRKAALGERGEQRIRKIEDGGAANGGMAVTVAGEGRERIGWE